MSLAIAGVRQAVLLTILFVTGSAFAYGLLADFSDLLFGFWGTFVVVLLPLLTLCAGLLLRICESAHCFDNLKAWLANDDGPHRGCCPSSFTTNLPMPFRRFTTFIFHLI
jgi:hypothetical protein